MCHHVRSPVPAGRRVARELGEEGLRGGLATAECVETKPTSLQVDLAADESV
jgi:hypothetical protein